jgi:hypothetical protein
MHLSTSMLCSFSSCAPLPLYSSFFLHFMLFVPVAFYVMHLFYIILVLCTSTFFPHAKTINKISASLLCFAFLSRQDLYHIIRATLHLLWKLSTVCMSSVVVILRLLASLPLRPFLFSFTVTVHMTVTGVPRKEAPCELHLHELALGVSASSHVHRM